MFKLEGGFIHFILIVVTLTSLTPVGLYAGGTDIKTGKLADSIVRTPSLTAEAKPQVNELIESTSRLNELKSRMASDGVNTNQAVQAQYQAELQYNNAVKAQLDGMASTGKYDTSGYKKLLAALSIPTSDFDYAPQDKGDNSIDSAETNQAPMPPPAPATITTPGLSLSATEGLSNPIRARQEIADVNAAVNEAPSVENREVPRLAASPSSVFITAPLTSASGSVSPMDSAEVYAAPRGEAASKPSRERALAPLLAQFPARGVASASEEAMEGAPPLPPRPELQAGDSKKAIDVKMEDKTNLVADTGSAPVATGAVPDKKPSKLEDTAMEVVSTFGPTGLGKGLLEGSHLEKMLLDRLTKRSGNKGINGKPIEAKSMPTEGAMKNVYWAAGMLVQMSILLGLGALVGAYLAYKSTFQQLKRLSDTPEAGMTAEIRLQTEANGKTIAWYNALNITSAEVVESYPLSKGSVVLFKNLSADIQQQIRSHSAGMDRYKYLGGGEFEKTSEPLCILVNVKGAPNRQAA
jgi:hypothetical protein